MGGRALCLCHLCSTQFTLFLQRGEGGLPGIAPRLAWLTDSACRARFDLQALLGTVRCTLNEIAEGWSREEKDACLEETPRTFSRSGELLQLISSSPH